MNFKGSLVLGLILLTALPLSADGKKKNVGERAMHCADPGGVIRRL